MNLHFTHRTNAIRYFIGFNECTAKNFLYSPNVAIDAHLLKKNSNEMTVDEETNGMRTDKIEGRAHAFYVKFTVSHAMTIRCLLFILIAHRSE